MRRNLLKSKEWMHQKYAMEYVSAEKLAPMLDCSPATVTRWLRKHEIPVRIPGRPSPATLKLQDREWLYNEYVTKQQSFKKITRVLRCSYYTLRKWLDYHDISVRPKHVVIYNYMKERGYKERVGPKALSWKGGKARCIDCGKLLSHYCHGSRCSKCFFAWHRGENHRDWIQPEERTVDESRGARRSIFFKEWRTAVFERDNYTCQKCQRRSQAGQRIKLHPHHIESFTKVVAKRYEVENGITFCEDCHITFHRHYGYGDNNRLQFNDFVSPA